MKTLLVQPESAPGSAVEAALAARQHVVTRVGDLAAACAALEAKGFGLVLLDADAQAQPEQACRRLRRAAYGRHGAILALTERTEPAHLAALLAAGAADYLSPAQDAAQLALRLAVAEARVADLPAPACVALSRAGCMAHDGPYGIFRSTLEGRFTHVTPSLARILGYANPEALLGVDLATDVYRDPADRRRLVAEGGDYIEGLELAWKRRDGSPITVRLSGRRVYDEHGGLAGFEGLIEDVTELKQAIEAVRTSEDRYRLIADHVTDMIWTSQIEGVEELIARAGGGACAEIGPEALRRWRFTYVSPSAARLLGFTADDVLAQGLEGVLPPESLRESARVLAEELAAEARGDTPLDRARTIEVLHLTRSGEARWCEVTSTVLRDAAGRFSGILGVTRDVHDRRLAEEALRESEAALRGLFENMPDFVIVVDLESKILFANRGAPGGTVQELVGRQGFGFIRPEYRAACEESLRQAIESRAPQAVECVDVFDVVWACRVVPLVRDGQVHSAIVICADVTEQRRAEAAIKKEQDLLRHLLELHERDRQLLAFELHDGFAQQLTGAVLNFEAAGEAFAADPERARAVHRTGMRLLREAIEESRRLVTGLRPPVLDQFGIVSAIEHLVNTHQSCGGPRIAFVSKGRFRRLARPLENAVFRIVQETLSNACRHSRSDRVQVELARDGGFVSIHVEDWGVGFDPRKVDERCFGLRGVRERARLLGGEAVVDTWPGHGTRVRVRLPLLEGAENPDVYWRDALEPSGDGESAFDAGI